MTVSTSWGAKARAVADEKGNWQVKVRTPPAQRLSKGLHPEHITFQARDHTVQIKDVLIGEVWLATGQSNMKMRLMPCYPPGEKGWYGEKYWSEPSAQNPAGAGECLKAERPGIRLFNVEESLSLTPAADCKGVMPDHLHRPPNKDGLIPDTYHGWQPSTRRTAECFSAVAYYFAVELQDKLDVPVGVVVSSLGGSRIESWIAADALQTTKFFSTWAGPRKNGFNEPAVLYNGMMAPLVPMSWSGRIWYQGEGNIGDPRGKYAELTKCLIEDWRRKNNDPAQPFYFVQLPALDMCAPDAIAEIRAAQDDALALPNTGMAVITDIADPSNIHPADKRTVGQRLARQALRKTYGRQEIAADGPRFQTAAFDGRFLRVSFQNTEKGLVTRDGKTPSCFEISHDGKTFLPAAAVIAGGKVEIDCAGNGQPLCLRLGWHNADIPNLASKDGLPAAPFNVQLK